MRYAAVTAVYTIGMIDCVDGRTGQGAVLFLASIIFGMAVEA